MEKRNQKKRIALLILGILVAVITALVALGLIYANNKLNNIQIDNSKDEEIIQNEELSDTTTSRGYRTIAVFGVDSRENRLENGTNSDTIVLVNINNSTKDIKLVSVYRDTYLNIPNKGYKKINSAYLYGGYSLALSALNLGLDLNITEYVTVNFKSVVHVIDLLGGITIDVTSSELKWLNGYIRELNRINGTSVTGLTTSGTQVLNGTQAVAYARIRYTSGGDFKRTERQRLVMEKIFEKVKGSSISTINQLANEILPEVSTNLSTSELLLLAKDVFSYNITDQTGFPFEVDSHYYNRISYVFPVNLAENVTKLHSYLFETVDYIPSQTVQTYSNEIEAIRTQ